MKQWLFIIVLFGSFTTLPGESRPGLTASILAEAGGENPFILLKQAEALYQKNTTRALDLIEDALLMALRQNNLPAQAASYELLAQINGYLEQFDLAAANYQRALQIYEQTENRAKALEMLKQSGEAYEQAGNFDKALANYRKYLAMAKEQKSSVQSKKYSREKSYDARPASTGQNELEEVQLAIPEILMKQKRYQESVQNLDSIAGNIDSAKNPDKLLNINKRRGQVYKAQDMDDEALSYFNANVRSARVLNKPKEEAEASSEIAEIYSASNRETDALKLRNRSIEIYNLTNDTAALAMQYLARGQLQRQLNRLTEATGSLLKAAGLAKEAGKSEVERESYRELAVIAEKRGQTQKALQYFKQYVALQDSALVQQKNELQKKLELNSSLSQQQQRIELLEKNEKINNSTIEILRAKQIIAEKSATNQKLIIYSLLGLILLLGISGYLMFLNMQRKRVANQLLALKSLRAQMNPHFIFNALNSVNHYISRQDERAANRYLSDFSRLMRAVLENSQEDFISLSQEKEIITLYLQLEHNRFADKFEYDLHFDEELNLENTVLPPMLVQPYVENAIWHGLRYRESKGHLLVKYQQQATGLKITVEDDGIGRSKSKALKTENQQKNNSTGMSNIENRVRIINSMYKTQIEALVYDLPENSGTRIEILIPLLNKNTLHDA